MGWSESYYADMKGEADREVGGCCQALLVAMADLREVVETYRDFVEHADELESLLASLERLLAEYGTA